MKNFIKCSFTVVVAALAIVLNAENIAKNGSFEEKGTCSAYNNLLKKGFKLNFKKNEWAQNWNINPSTQKADISLVSDKKAVEGKKYLEIKNTKDVHIYSNQKLPGDFSYNISFSAKAPAGNNKLYICIYMYKVKKHKYIASKVVKTIKLTEKWQKYSLELPEYGDDKTIMVALGINGACDLDNIIIDMKE